MYIKNNRFLFLFMPGKNVHIGEIDSVQSKETISNRTTAENGLYRKFFETYVHTSVDEFQWGLSLVLSTTEGNLHGIFSITMHRVS